MKALFHRTCLLGGIVLVGACATQTAQARLMAEYQAHERGCESRVVKSWKYKKYLAIHRTNRQYHLLQNLKKGRAYAVLAGDSIAALFFEGAVKKYLPGVDVANRGIGGDTSELLLHRIAEDVMVLRPRVVIISISGNDLIQERCTNFILGNVSEIILKIQKFSPRTRILFTSVPPVYEEQLNGIVVHYNDRLRKLVANQKGVTYIDLHSRLVNPGGTRLDEKYWLKGVRGKYDRVHFNEAGYKQWAQLLRPHMQTN